MKLTLPTPPAFRFGSAVCSHGFFVLAPNLWTPSSSQLTTAITLSDERAVTVAIREHAGHIMVQSPAALGPADRGAIRTAVRRMLRLDEDFGGFHARCRKSATHRLAAKTGSGRLFRSPSLFEDLVKVICTCNVTWRQTVTMVEAIVRCWGVPAVPIPIGQNRKGAIPKANAAASRSQLRPQPSWACCPRGFPTAARLARAGESAIKRLARVGYRASFIHRLARDAADGRLDLQTIEQFNGPTADLQRMLRAIHGVGDYAAGHICMLMGRYDCLAIDTETVRLFKHRYPARTWTPAAIRAHYAPWRPYQFLAYWFELWQDYVERHGLAEDWSPEQIGPAITTP